MKERIVIMSGEDNFVSIYPSNAQPDIFKNNTASSFSTRLRNSKTLNGPWEVAVKDLSFVNTIQTFKNEKMTLHKMEKKYVDFYVVSSLLEKQDRIASYDLSHFSDEWLLSVKPYYPKWKQRRVIFDHILSSFNSMIGQFFYFAFNQNKIYGRYFIKDGSKYYGLFCSDQLKSILNLKHHLLLPRGIFKDGNRNHFYRTGVATDVGWNINFNRSPAYDKEKPIYFTLLPLHRMERKTVTIEKDNINDYVSEFNEKMRRYGLIIAMNEKKPKDDEPKAKKKRQTSDDGDEVTLQYTNHLRTSNVAFIYIPLNTFDHRNDKTIYFYQPTTQTVQLRLRDNKKFPKTEIVIYFNEIYRRKERDVKTWVRDIDLPTNYYKNERLLLKVLNEQNLQTVGDERDFFFSFNDGTNRFQLEVKKSFILNMSEKLKSILGFDQTEFYEGKHKATHVPIINRNNHHFYLYTNIISPISVGGERVRLLCYIPIPNAEYGDVVHKEFLTPIYLPVSTSQLQQVDFLLCDDTGEQIHFEEGRTVVTLHFRQRNYV